MTTLPKRIPKRARDRGFGKSWTVPPALRFDRFWYSKDRMRLLREARLWIDPSSICLGVELRRIHETNSPYIGTYEPGSARYRRTGWVTLRLLIPFASLLIHWDKGVPIPETPAPQYDGDSDFHLVPPPHCDA